MVVVAKAKGIEESAIRNATHDDDATHNNEAALDNGYDYNLQGDVYGMMVG